ncbi:hypothetical protein BC830DRAFT_1141085 [Chytriomyces sp. MP71]|nr:hypothetical protein BC830DRAFT_1141085 [Chytriomyces sp. MP71]
MPVQKKEPMNETPVVKRKAGRPPKMDAASDRLVERNRQLGRAFRERKAARMLALEAAAKSCVCGAFCGLGSPEFVTTVNTTKKQHGSDRSSASATSATSGSLSTGADSPPSFAQNGDNLFMKRVNSLVEENTLLRALLGLSIGPLDPTNQALNHLASFPTLSATVADSEAVPAALTLASQFLSLQALSSSTVASNSSLPSARIEPSAWLMSPPSLHVTVPKSPTFIFDNLLSPSMASSSDPTTPHSTLLVTPNLAFESILQTKLVAIGPALAWLASLTIQKVRERLTLVPLFGRHSQLVDELAGYYEKFTVQMNVSGPGPAHDYPLDRPEYAHIRKHMDAHFAPKVAAVMMRDEVDRGSFRETKAGVTNVMNALKAEYRGYVVSLLNDQVPILGPPILG